jgi:hypothetical protein
VPIYPAPPGPRIAYDRDGSVGFQLNGAWQPSVLANSVLQTANDETDSTFQVDQDPWTFGVIFPVAMTILGVYVNVGWWDGGPWSGQTEYSADTTTGADGTWTAMPTGVPFQSQPTVPNYRSSIVAQSGVTTAKAVRFWWSHLHWYDSVHKWVNALHLYGYPTAANPDKLALWDPTSDARLAGGGLDFGDIVQGTSGDLAFRVKNLSATKTATGVVVSDEVIADTTPSTASQFTFSFGGGGLASSVNIGDLAPGVISGVVTIHRNTPTNAALSAAAARVTAVPTTFA